MVVDSNLRFFKGGGDKDASLASALLVAVCFAVMIFTEHLCNTKATLRIASKARWLKSSKLH